MVIFNGFAIFFIRKNDYSKSLSYIFYFFTLNNLIYSQDSIVVQMSMQHIESIDSVFAQRVELKKSFMFIYGEYHDYEKTNELANNLFFKTTAYKNEKKIYFIEGGASIGYIIDKYNHNHDFLHYKWGTTLPIDKQNLLKNTAINLKKIFLKDTTVKFISFDCELLSGWPLICFYDIIKNSDKDEIFKLEINYFERKFSFFNSNKKLRKASDFFIRAFINDSLKYKSNISNENFYYYREIIRGLKTGLLIDSLKNAMKTYYEKAELRESHLYDNITNNIDKYKPDFVFIHTGLLHSLDTFLYFPNKSPWVSVSERLSARYGKEKITKLGLIRLSDIGKYNYTIYNREIIEKMEMIAPLNDKFINLEFIKPYIKTKFDYAIFIE